MADYKVVDAEQLESDLTVVADAIREKSGKSEALAFPNGMADAVRGIQSGGLDLCEYATTFLDAFKNTDFGGMDEIHLKIATKLENPIFQNTSLRQIFMYTKGVKKIKLTVKESTEIIPSTMNMFYSSSDLEIVDITDFKTKVNIFTQMFSLSKKLRKIIGEIDFSYATTTTGVFSSCVALEEIRIKKESLSLSTSFGYNGALSSESIQSIIDGLADLTGGTAQTITWHKSVYDKLTDEQKVQISNKNWVSASA